MFSEAEVIEQELLQVFRTLVADLEPHRSTMATCRQLAFKRMYKIADFFFIQAVWHNISGEYIVLVNT